MDPDSQPTEDLTELSADITRRLIERRWKGNAGLAQGKWEQTLEEVRSLPTEASFSGWTPSRGRIRSALCALSSSVTSRLAASRRTITSLSRLTGWRP